MELAWLVEDGGHSVVGPESSVAATSKALDKLRIDLAILDIRLTEETTFSVADRLDSRSIPYLFVTGVVAGLPDAYRTRPLIAKACPPQILLGWIGRLLDRDNTACDGAIEVLSAQPSPLQKSG